MPRPTVMAELSDLLEVDQSWLAFGIQAEMPRVERRFHSARSDGAVQYMWGLMALSGNNCALPSKGDQKREYVDFYVVNRGTMYPIHVALAREVSPNMFQVTVPKEYNEVRCIAVMPASAGRYHSLSLRGGLIDQHKTRKGGGYLLHINRVDSKRYQSGLDTWPMMRFEQSGLFD